jgi:DNA invertase Pin-like site-specific DNA recombinase
MPGQRDTSQYGGPGSGWTAYLTARQAEVLQLAARGLSGKQIGRHLGISVRTVEGHFSGMRQRTGARSDGELIAHAVAAGFVTPAPVPALRPGRRLGAAAQDAVEPGQREGAGKRSFFNTRTAAGPNGALVGYARAATAWENLGRQVRLLEEAGCSRVFADRQYSKAAERPELRACLDCLHPGDTLVVPSLDRLSRSLQDLVALVAGLPRRGVGFRSLHEALDTSTPDGRLVFHVFAALAEFIRELIVQGTQEGIQAARARGVRLGRPPVMTPEQIGHARALLSCPDNTVSSIARLLGVSRSTIYKHVPELAAGARPPMPDHGRDETGG